MLRGADTVLRGMSFVLQQHAALLNRRAQLILSTMPEQIEPESNDEVTELLSSVDIGARLDAITTFINRTKQCKASKADSHSA